MGTTSAPAGDSGMGARSAPATGGPKSDVLSAEASDPRRMGWMEGFPPPPERTIRGFDSDFFRFPKLRWSVCHMRQLRPTVRVARGLGPPRLLPRDIDPALDGIDFELAGTRKTMTWREAQDAAYTDGIVVLHEGRIVYERYSGCLRPSGQHAAMSMTKSLIGLLAEILVQEGTLDERAAVGNIVPELAESAFGNATVRQVMDMTTSLDYSEDYTDPKASVWVYSASGNPFPRELDDGSPEGYWAFLTTVGPSGPHGEAFGYRTVNTDVLAWVLARTTEQSVADLLSDRIWSRIGAEQSAYFQVDSTGTPFAGGGLSAGLRDMARIGLLMLQEGRLADRRVFPSSVAKSIRAGGDREAFADGYPSQMLKGASYRSMWWVLHDDHGAFAARGVHGQTVYVDPKAEMVIARFASHPVAGNAAIDPISLPAYRALASHLLERKEGRASK